MKTEHQRKLFCNNRTTPSSPVEMKEQSLTCLGSWWIPSSGFNPSPSRKVHHTLQFSSVRYPESFFLYSSWLKLPQAGVCYQKTRNLKQNIYTTRALPLLPWLHPRTSLPKISTPFITPASFLTPLSNHQFIQFLSTEHLCHARHCWPLATERWLSHGPCAQVHDLVQNFFQNMGLDQFVKPT